MNNRLRSLLSVASVLFLFTTSVGLVACSHNKTKDQQEEHHHTEAEESGTIELTSENVKAANIRLGKIAYKELSATIRANGSLRVPNTDKGFVSSLYGGVVQRILAHEGQQVRRGQTIATISSPQFIQTQEEYLSTVSKFAYAEQELQRQEMLKNSDAGTGKLLQSARSELNVLRSQRASLAQQLRLMGINPSHLSANNLQPSIAVVSPVDGVVGKIKAQVGGYIDPTTPVCEVINNKALHLDLHIYEQDLPKLKIGQRIHFRLTNDPDQEYDATIHTIGGTFEPNARTVAVHCSLIGNTANFIDGMDITGLVSLGDVLSPALPNESIINDEGKDYVFVRIPNEKVKHTQRGDKTGAEKYSFRKIAILKGASNLGYTSITFLEEAPKDGEYVTRGAFFVNAAMNPAEDHGH